MSNTKESTRVNELVSLTQAVNFATQNIGFWTKQKKVWQDAIDKLNIEETPVAGTTIKDINKTNSKVKSTYEKV